MLRCLAAVRATTDHLDVEVVVVDDSTHGLRCLADQPIVAIRNENNLGFLRSTNRGVAASTGQFVVLLNNDTEPSPGWLDAMIALGVQESVGIVGAKLLSSDSTVQEAGATIWPDGSATKFGAGQAATANELSFVRRVGYVSGACMFTMRRLWDRLGGLDDRFAPAYYEDADFAFAVRQLGLDVLYQPAAVIAHRERASYKESARALMAANRARFVAKWSKRLAHLADHRIDPLQRPYGGALHRVVLVSAAPPSVTLDLVGLLRAERAEISVAAEPKLGAGTADELRQTGIEVLHPEADRQVVLARSNHSAAVVLVNRESAISIIPAPARDILATLLTTLVVEHDGLPGLSWGHASDLASELRRCGFVGRDPYESWRSRTRSPAGTGEDR